MPNYSVVEYALKPVEGDDQVELVILAGDGSRWEYGIPFSRSSGRYMFEEIDVLEMDFGEEFSERIAAELDALVAKLVG
jgi:hypothetical protein